MCAVDSDGGSGKGLCGFHWRHGGEDVVRRLWGMSRGMNREMDREMDKWSCLVVVNGEKKRENVDNVQKENEEKRGSERDNVK